MPFASAAPAQPLQALNTAVVGFFDRAQAWLSTLPGGPLSDFVSGTLLLVRRNLFNQSPTADPYQFSTKATGQLVGTLGGVEMGLAAAGVPHKPGGVVTAMGYLNGNA